jgi:hypothetical protein
MPAGRRRIDLNFPENALRQAVGCAASLDYNGEWTAYHEVVLGLHLGRQGEGNEW